MLLMQHLSMNGFPGTPLGSPPPCPQKTVPPPTEPQLHHFQQNLRLSFVGRVFLEVVAAPNISYFFIL